MSKEAMRAEADRLIREAMAKKTVTIKQGDQGIETKCGRRGRPLRHYLARRNPRGLYLHGGGGRQKTL